MERREKNDRKEEKQRKIKRKSDFPIVSKFAKFRGNAIESSLVVTGPS